MTFDETFMTEQLYEILKESFKEISSEDFEYTVGFQDEDPNRLNISIKHTDEGTLYFYRLKISQT